MTREEWKKVKDVLDQALAVATEDRPAFLDRACDSDKDLRREVESLLSASDDVRTSFLQSAAPPVVIKPGTKLGEYEVVKLIGAGGMGEVYRAHDARLKRDVAIKVLPSFVANDPDRLRRFEQEARAAAALNHPNILAVFQMGAYEGAPYLVSELLEGTTLREQLHGPLPLRKAIDYGVQIARGLAAAHEKGIAHRDLKPENLFVTKDGRVKILDFGLAKLTQLQKHSDHTAPTVATGTEPGVVMGTVGYTSPEQVRGQAADHRSDIFAFGAVLYEMLSGKRAFQKPTSAETMSAILNEDPPAISQIALTVPPALQRVVHRCLEKNPEQRFQSASDLAFALEALSDSGSTAPQTGTNAAKSSRWQIGAALIVLLVLLFGLLSYKFFATSGPAIDVRNVRIRKLTEHGQAIPWACISPDGKLVAYIKREKERSLRVIQISTGSEVVVVPPQPGFFGNEVMHAGITFTPDGNYLYYTHNDPVNENVVNIYSVPAFGGVIRRVVTDVASGMAFSADGAQMVYWRNAREGDHAELVVASSDGSDERVIFRDRGTYSRNTPSWSNAKNLIASIRYDPQKTGLSSIQVLTPEGKSVEALSMPLMVWNVEWRPDSSGLFFVGYQPATHESAQIWFQPYPKGNPVKISNDLSTYRSLSATADGESVLSTEEQRSASVYVGHTPAVLSENANWNFTAVASEGAPEAVSWAADGKLLETDYSNHAYLMAPDGSNRMRLLQASDVVSPAVSCGPNLMIFGKLNKEENGFHLWRSSMSGEDAKQITFGKDEEGPVSCTPDGKWVVYDGVDSAGAEHIYKTSIEGGEPVTLAEGDVSLPAVSPNGELVAYEKSEANSSNETAKLIVQKLAGGPPVLEFESWRSAGPGYQLPGWTPDGQALTYLANSSGSVVNIFMQPLNRSRPVQLTHFESEPAFVTSYAWSRDGNKFALVRSRYNDTDVVLFSGLN